MPIVVEARKRLLPVKVLLFESRVVEETVMEEPRETDEPLMVMLEFARKLFAMAVPFQTPPATVPRYEVPETEKAVDEAYGNWDARVEEAKYAGAVYAVVVSLVLVPKFVSAVHGQLIPPVPV